MDPAYENVILHVVWDHDTEIFRRDNSAIPVLELKHYVSDQDIRCYQDLLTPKSWIFCETHLKDFEGVKLSNWLDRLFLERLESRTQMIEGYLKQNSGDWEAVLFWMLAKNFGLNTNGDVFLEIARSIPFNVIRREIGDIQNLEALFFGRSGLLDSAVEDHYVSELHRKYRFLTAKYCLKETVVPPLQFFKHRPDNFPTIRIAQLASLYHQRQNLFSALIEARTIKQFNELLGIGAGTYWNTHFLFGKESANRKKEISKGFITLLLINTVIPLRFAYFRSLGLDHGSEAIDLASEVAAESNGIIDRFRELGIDAKSAFESQALLELKNEYCNKRRCLDCSIGLSLMRPPN